MKQTIRLGKIDVYFDRLCAGMGAFLFGCLLILLLLAFVRIGYAVEAQQVPGSRYLVLSSLLDDPEVIREIETAKKAGPVLPIIGRMFVTGESYEHVLFLYVRDQGFQHRIVYFKTLKSHVPIVLVALPGGMIDVKLAALFSERKKK